ncbi:MAG: hypothetical protein PHV68_00755, partial [Candidatus Gastranaerophilales bacterium]|nr:hypothetical protein [Candidatus Gastranaerophilales bacterium]
QYNKYAETFKNEIINNKDFRKFISMSQKEADKITGDNIKGVPVKSAIRRLGESFFSPITAPVKFISKQFKSDEQLAKIENFESIKKNFEVVEEFVNGVFNRNKVFKENWKIDNSKIDAKKIDDLIIPEDLLSDKLKRKRLNTIKPAGAPYSLTALSTSNRLISGILGGVFLATDAYNTTMLYSKSQNESRKEAKTRFSQEITRIGLTAYLNIVILDTFAKATKKSLFAALALSGAVVLISDTLGRKLLGRPILPSSYDKLLANKEEIENRNDVLAKFGRMINGEEVNKTKKPPANTNANSNKIEKTEMSQFLNQNNAVSFSGNPGAIRKLFKPVASIKKAYQGLTVTEKISKKDFEQFINLMEKIDEKHANFCKSKVLEKNPNYDELTEFVFGKKDLPIKKFLDAVFKPVNWIKNGIGYVVKKVQKITNSIKKPDITEQLQKKIAKKEAKLNAEGTLSAFNDFLKTQEKSDAWKNSPLSIEQKKNLLLNNFDNKENKKAKVIIKEFNNYFKVNEEEKFWSASTLKPDEKLELLVDEFNRNSHKLNEELKGIKNSFNWMRDVLSKEDFKKAEEGILLEKKKPKQNLLQNLKDNFKFSHKKDSISIGQFLNKIENKEKGVDDYLKYLEKEKFGKLIKKADGSIQQTYEKSDYAVLNFPVAKGVSSFFIISDIYNLAMLHTKGDKEKTNETAKNRTIQEASRIIYSAYIMQLTMAMFQKWHDKFLSAAMGVTVINSISREILARKTVNMPLTPQSYENLKALDEKQRNMDTKNPFKKALIAVVGDRSRLSRSKTENKETATSMPINNTLTFIKNSSNSNDFVKNYIDKNLK